MVEESVVEESVVKGHQLSARGARGNSGVVI